MSSRYAYNPHARSPVDSFFETPSVDTVIWRYLPLDRFVSLLESRRLFLCRAGRLEDEFEGVTPVVSEQKLMDWEAEYTSPEIRAQYRMNRERARQIVAVNCWHISECESVPMWDRYGRGGVAIKSTVGRLGAALPQRPDNGVFSNEDIGISRVRYIDYEKGHFPLWTTFHHFIHKRLAYASEEELRVFAMITDGAVEAGIAGGTDFEITDGGLLIPVDIETLIEAIYIAPRADAAVEQTVRDLLLRMQLVSIPVQLSCLTAEPIY